MATAPKPTHSHSLPGPHAVPMRVLATTLIVLLALTFITVAATWYDFGAAGNLWIALIIATVKATLVALYFMHLRYDKPFNAVILICALLFLLLFCSLTLLDTRQYAPDVDEFRAASPTNYAPELRNP